MVPIVDLPITESGMLAAILVRLDRLLELAEISEEVRTDAKRRGKVVK
jgi:hypothetical protein